MDSLFTSQDTSPKPLPVRDQLSLSRIDLSMRSICLFFFVASLVWLLVGTAFALVASISLHAPHLMPSWEWLTFGRMRSAHLNAVAYGWGNNVAFGVALWIMARLCRSEIRHGGLLTIAGIVWNLGVTIGIFGILNGQLTSVEWLEMPTYVAPSLAVAYVMIGAWGVLAFCYRSSEHVYVSQWYILAGLFWFPWLYTIVQIMIFMEPARGTVQSIVNWWFGHNVLGLWFTPIGLATAYYLIPKVLGVPIRSYYLSLLGFWSLALFYNWAGTHHLIAGPVPVWVTSVGTVASVMMVIPVIVTAINHHATVSGHFHAVWSSPTLRFVIFGAMSYTLTSFLGSAMALREVNVVTHFTNLTIGHAHHGLYAFFTMVMFGAIYYMMPRLLNREWPSARLIRIHFWCVAIGIFIMVTALHIGGWLQGLEMNNPEIPFLEVMAHTVPWLQARSISGILIALGHIAFFINFMWMLLLTQPSQQQGPTLIPPFWQKSAEAPQQN